MANESGFWPVELEIRQVGGARVLTGTFPYGPDSMATIADRGSTRKEYFNARAFKFALEDPDRRLDILVGHDFGKPIASRQSGSLTLTETDAAVSFEAVLPVDPPSWVIDAEKAIDSGLMTGLSPGFRVPPRSAVRNAEELLPEPGNPGVMIRKINEAVLREFSVVTSPTYIDAAVELRSDEHGGDVGMPRRETLWL